MTPLVNLPLPKDRCRSTAPKVFVNLLPLTSVPLFRYVLMAIKCFGPQWPNNRSHSAQPWKGLIRLWILIFLRFVHPPGPPAGLAPAPG